MDVRFQVNDPPRPVVHERALGLPLVTIAWRALRADYQRRSAERRQADAEARQLQEVLVRIAEEVHRLRRATRGEGPGQVEPLRIAAERLEQALASAGVAILAPEGGSFTGEMMELFDNVAQRLAPDVHEPTIAEVIAPAVTRRGGLLRMGKAVIAVPSGQHLQQ